MTFIDPHDVVGVPDGVSLEDLEIAYIERQQQLINSNPVSIEELKYLESAYEFLVSEYDDSIHDNFEESIYDEADGETKTDNKTIEFQKEIIEHAQSIINNFTIVNSQIKVSKFRVFLLIALLSVFLTIWPLPVIITAILLGILYVASKKNKEVSYDYYKNAIAEDAECQRILLVLKDRWDEKESNFSIEYKEKMNDYLGKYSIIEAVDNGEIFGIRERAKQLKVNTALDVLLNSDRQLLEYGVGEKSITKVKNWAKKIKDNYVESDVYIQLCNKLQEEKYGLAEEIIPRMELWGKAQDHIEKVKESLKKNIFMRFWLDIMMIPVENTEFIEGNEDSKYDETNEEDGYFNEYEIESPKKSSNTWLILLFVVVFIIYISNGHKNEPLSEIKNAIPQARSDIQQNPLEDKYVPSTITDLKGLVDCTRSDNLSINVLICSDEQLLSLDMQMNNLNIKLREINDVSKWDDLRENQENWNNKRFQLCKIKPFNDIGEQESSRLIMCLRDIYQFRINELESKLSHNP